MNYNTTNNLLRISYNQFVLPYRSISISNRILKIDVCLYGTCCDSNLSLLINNTITMQWNKRRN